MIEAQLALVIASGLTLMAYAGWVVRLIRRCATVPFDSGTVSELDALTVLIPCRNEVERLPSLLRDLQAQTHPVRVLVIDDGSSDATVEAALRAGVDCIPANGKGKKAALATGYAAAETPWLATVDADVRLGPEWARTLLTAATAHGAACVLGEVVIDGAATAWTRFQQLEFAVMQCWISGGVQSGKLAMGSGANSLYRTEDYPVSELMPRFASGDDAFALKALRNRGMHLHWCGNAAGRVMTEPASDWKSLWQQRARWASKTGGQDRETRTTALTVAAVHGMGLVLLMHAAASGTAMATAVLLGFWGGKALLDVPLLRLACRQFGWSLRAADGLLFSLRYAALVWGAWWQLLFGRVHWKGRQI